MQQQPMVQVPQPAAAAPADNPFAANPFGSGGSSSFKPTVKEFKPSAPAGKIDLGDDEGGFDHFAKPKAKQGKKKLTAEELKE